MPSVVGRKIKHLAFLLGTSGVQQNWPWMVLAVVLLTATAVLCIAADSAWRNDVLSNFVADFWAGVVIGGGILGFWQLRRQQTEEQKAKHERAKRYLEYLEKEIALLAGYLPLLYDRLSQSDTAIGSPGLLSSPFWDVVRYSGDLPGLIAPELLANVASFYGCVENANRAHQFVVSSLAQQTAARERALFRQWMIGDIERAKRHLQERALLSSIQTEISILTEELRDHPDPTRILKMRLEQLGKELDAMTAASSEGREPGNQSSEEKPQ
jgi:hypothetical protein